MVQDQSASGRARISAHWLARRAEHEGDLPAVSFDGRTWTYGALWTQVERTAAVLAAGGLRCGDRVAYLGLNHPDFLVCFFAATKLGAIFVPLNYRLTASELQHALADAGVHTLVVATGHTSSIDGLRNQATLPCRRYLASGGAPARWEDMDALVLQAGRGTVSVWTTPDVAAVIMYTSGTTGRPKGAVLSHENLWNASVNLMATVGLASSDIAMNCAPLFHVGGLCIVVLPVLLAGGHVILLQSFDPATYLQTISRHRVTVSFAVPTMMTALQQHPSFDAADLSSLRLLVAGGASVPASLLRHWQRRGISVSQGWGMTESTATGTFLAPSQADRRLGSCGKPALLSDCRLVDADGHEIRTADTPGEICVRGANVMLGYWQRPDADAESFDADGWFRSGDIGYFDQDGYYYVCGRLKDLVITGGENVYPAEVEAVLREHPAVAEVAVVGVPDDRWGERVVAIVVCRQDQGLTLDALRNFARQQLAGYKCPQELHLRDDLPRNASGKVLKSVLQDELRDAQASTERAGLSAAS